MYDSTPILFQRELIQGQAELYQSTQESLLR